MIKVMKEFMKRDWDSMTPLGRCVIWIPLWVGIWALMPLFIVLFLIARYIIMPLGPVLDKLPKLYKEGK